MHGSCAIFPEERGFSKEESQKIMAPQASSTPYNCMQESGRSMKIGTSLETLSFLRPLSLKKLTSYFTWSLRGSCLSNPGKDIKLPSWGLPLALVCQDPLPLNLPKSFLRETLGALQSFPALDLSFVLFSKVKEPFEPISEIPLKLLTLKDFSLS